MNPNGVCRNLKPVLETVFLLMFLGGAAAYGREESQEPPFSYVGGTEDVLEGCKGTLELTSNELAFKCAQYSVITPYAAISVMQYRPDVASKIRKMKLKWKIRPPVGGGKKNHYFTVVFDQGGQTHVMVLEVPSQAMQPYLAEVDLKAGKRIEVKGYEEYDQ